MGDITLRFLQNDVIGVQTVLVIYLGARMILNAQGFSLGMLMAFLSFRQTFSDRSLSLVNEIMQFHLLRLHLERLADIVTAEPDIAHRDDRPPRMIDLRGGIELHNVSFRYGAGSRWCWTTCRCRSRRAIFRQ